MPAKKPAQKSSVPASMPVKVSVSRGDCTVEVDATAGTVLAVARYLITTVRQLAAEAPDTLPMASDVPGNVVSYDWDDPYQEGQGTRVGFR